MDYKAKKNEKKALRQNEFILYLQYDYSSENNTERSIVTKVFN